MVCFKIDDYLFERDTTMWVAELSDGTTVYQDDYRPGLEPIAWLRLRDHLYENRLNIRCLFAKFRSHTELIGSSDYGYFFRNGVLGMFGAERTIQRFVFGLLNEDDKFNVQIWNVPELILDKTEERANIGHEDCLILNQKCN